MVSKKSSNSTNISAVEEYKWLINSSWAKESIFGWWSRITNSWQKTCFWVKILPSLGVSKTIPRLCFSSDNSNLVLISLFQSNRLFSLGAKLSGIIQAITSFEGKLRVIQW
ncbi:hypothetical protein WEN_00825 [Mycoplasma wenyonii str. Massachusetts]|uniref:Uncharacterized protein n=1 Tax=Mycoplasma wenyonii (strain Massachusetts) TaxID=1197325 RepID=I6Z5X3_MYCWM|nr:hypothetical protein WEN_00825 [Mycoplasma wenyonii str. Massachusetts]